MSSFILGIVSIFCLLVLSGSVHAVPICYTLQGEVKVIGNDAAGIISEAGLEVGSIVNYTFLVDFDVQGYQRLNDGTIISISDSFYVNYVSGSALGEKNGGYYNDWASIAENNYGKFVLGLPGSRETVFNVNSADNLLTLDILSDPAFWVLGRDFGTFSNIAYDSSGKYSWMLGGPLYITDISTSSPEPVPEPSTFIMLGFGAIILFALRRKHSVRAMLVSGT